MSIPVGGWSKAWVCVQTLPKIAGSNHADGSMSSLVSVVCSQTEVSASDWSLVQRGPTDYGVPECDREASKMRRSWPTRGCCAMGGGGETWYISYETSLHICISIFAQSCRKKVRRDRYTPDIQMIHVASYYVLVVIQHTVWVPLYFTNPASSNRDS
jgi:hypothetical protein